MVGVLLIVPLIGALAVALCRSDLRARWIALGFTAVELLISLVMWWKFDLSKPGFQFVEVANWLPNLSVKYKVGVDGLSLIMVVMTTLLTFVAVASAWSYIERRRKLFYALLLMLETAMVGVFVSLDLLLFYIFWEAMLIPMALIIGIWGGERRIYSALKFFIYTFAGSIFLLIGMVVLVIVYGGLTGQYTFDIQQLTAVKLPVELQKWLFWAFFLAFAVKVPVFPFHTWLPDAHVEAPTPGSVILAGVLLKMGTYGFLRFSLPLFPDAYREFAPVIFALGVVAIIYTALVALVQDDVKKVVAYSSVSHMGFVMIGLFSLNVQGIEGAVFQMLNHGLVSAALFFLVGAIYERLHTRSIRKMGGLAEFAPKLATLAMLFTMANVGLPGTSSFIGEFLTILGGFKAATWVGVLMALGVIFGAAYMLYMYRNVFFLEPKILSFKDLNRREFLALALLAVLVVWWGFNPEFVMKYIHTYTAALLRGV
ncbi:proton-translocating NADH-quinone oxidoreductase, chain M [Thermovibrio ammonificans HB-1]|uniref:Proton-translocating NADH-quinone oxidoreductase, chain M n=1 Tax=Thermovibrio ammonificans (strain DSM 15698 / JCM 12110 / HB-1) TaxID=648996 RepID=E8T6C7_THEA1|nr:NADH-quinone oxidoreductase subunit M [Thermovibrio ammonificans]ADU96711.1 proton-translocating NADH-quinone oxidoreductase, chain M [Thermovibrio ammonificans HB-1]